MSLMGLLLSYMIVFLIIDTDRASHPNQGKPVQASNAVSVVDTSRLCSRNRLCGHDLSGCTHVLLVVLAVSKRLTAAKRQQSVFCVMKSDTGRSRHTLSAVLLENFACFSDSKCQFWHDCLHSCKGLACLHSK